MSRIADLNARYRNGLISPVEATRASLDAIAGVSGTLRAFTHVAEDEALAAAAAAEERWRMGEPLGPLDGVPATVKDLLPVAGWPLRLGSLTERDSPPAAGDAPAVARLRAAGAVLIGQTAAPEFSWKGVTDSALNGITRNPWNLERTPGGSSGGAAVAAALDLGLIHLGTDASGSIRIPAAFSGVFGLKPTYGRVPAWPASPLTHVGPLAGSAADLALVLDVITAGDARDWNHVAVLPPGRFRERLEDGVRGLNVAVSATLGGQASYPAAQAALARAVAALGEAGATLHTADPPTGDARSIIDVLYAGGYVRRLGAMDDSRLALVDPGLRALAEAGRGLTLADHLAAQDARAQLACRLSQFFAGHDLLLCPVVPCPPFATGQDVPEPATQRWVTDWATYCHPFNLGQQPAASVPCGLDDDGLPVAVQVVGPKYREDLVLRACRVIETALPMPACPYSPRI